MNWIKENKFLTGFFAAMLVGIGVLGYLLFTAMGKAEEATNLYTEQAGELDRLQNLPLSANKKNLDALVAQKKDAVDAIAAFQSMLAGKAFPTEPMSPEQFQDKLKATKNAVVEKAQGVTKLPDKFYLGFDPYETRPPDNKDVAALLGHELKAIEWIFNQLIESRVTELKTPVKRDPLPEESGKVRTGEKGDKKTKPPLVTTNSIELTLQCRQNSLATFLNALVSPKAPQFYTVRTIRLKNENEKGPPRVDPNAIAIAPAAPALPPPGSPPVADAPAAPGAPAAAQAIAKYIVGEEQLEVTLQIDIVDFAQPAVAAAPLK